MYIFKVKRPEELFSIADVIRGNSFDIKKSELYEFKNDLYLCIYTKSDDTVIRDIFIPAVDKIAQRCKWNIINDSILKEWGVMISDNIIKEITAT